MFTSLAPTFRSSFLESDSGTWNDLKLSYKNWCSVCSTNRLASLWRSRLPVSSPGTPGVAVIDEGQRVLENYDMKYWLRMVNVETSAHWWKIERKPDRSLFEACSYTAKLIIVSDLRTLMMHTNMSQFFCFLVAVSDAYLNMCVCVWLRC